MAGGVAAGLGAEARLLLDLCRSYVGGGADDISLPLDRKLDWQLLLRLASRHKLVSVLHRGLRGSSEPEVPPDVMAALRDNADGTLRRNMMLARELATLVERCAGAGLRVMPLKGPAWAQALHGTITHRQFSDLDLLVDEAEVEATMAVLRGCGIEVAYARPPRIWGEYALASADNVVKIDLHWRLAPTSIHLPLAFDRLWRDRRSVRCVGADLPLPAVDDLLLILCFYVTKELWWVSLSYLVDLARLLGSETAIDWDRILCRAREMRALDLTLFSLALTSELLDVAIPLPELAARRSSLRPQVEAVARSILRDADASSWYPSHYEKCRWHLRVRERWRDGLRPVAYLPLQTLAPTAKEIEQLGLPRPLAPLNYAARPLLVLSRTLRNFAWRR